MPVAAHGVAAFDAGRAFRGFGVHADHTAGRVAVQRRVGAAQHFDALEAADVDVRQRALAVGHGGGNAIHIQAHTAQPEGRARAIAAHRQLQVLGVVLAVVDLQAGHAGQDFRQVDLHLALTCLPGVDHAHRSRRLFERSAAQRAVDRDRRELGFGGSCGDGGAVQAADQYGQAGSPAQVVQCHAKSSVFLQMLAQAWLRECAAKPCAGHAQCFNEGRVLRTGGAPGSIWPKNAIEPPQNSTPWRKHQWFRG
ncbi:hypothetical protein D3C78_1257080 [compost metagenome]